MHGPLDVPTLFRNFRGPVVVTWFLVLLENTLLALFPLFIGRAIDALLQAQTHALLELGIVMGALVVVASIRRAYDTRCYGRIRVAFGAEVVRRLAGTPVSQVNARMDMSREMVDFLEEQVPRLLTASVQVVASIVILWTFEPLLGATSTAVIVGLGLVYSLFHGRFFRLNAELNSQVEQQIDVLSTRHPKSLLEHLNRLRHSEVQLSDTEVMLYGGLYICMFTFIVANLWLAAAIPAVTAGAMFAILSYSWELVESGIALPVVLQSWSRLSEIRTRLNATA